MSFLFFVLVAILGLGLLIIIHETGHFLAARYFGLRVTKYSIGFGPAIYKKQPKGSPTTYQIAIIPFLAYVQVAGMNPFEDIDPKDKGSYANAPVHARIVTIFSGSLANYLAASVLFFVALMVGGEDVTTTSVEVMPDGAAASGRMQSGDKIVEIAGEPIDEWNQLRSIIMARGGKLTPIVVEREGKRVALELTPEGVVGQGDGRIGVKSVIDNVPISVSKAAWLSVKRPPEIVVASVTGIGRVIARKEKAELMGPVGMVNEMAKAAKTGFVRYAGFLGMLSAYLAGFNLLPFPALDGGRLMFLAYEAASRRRPNARVEAHIHAVGLLFLLSLIAVVTVFSDIRSFGD